MFLALKFKAVAILLNGKDGFVLAGHTEFFGTGLQINM
jgi:hypothetical protein